ncbi:YdeI/OmpD-associated family protein [Larkinella soli]|uniref:YdeI/OmpD-associated family protein n=1 Tax=Larkinella soli TaxID=1770527 RepID=UPI000FFBAF67|nr:YdeI/OmpD-associated family protein [Larkinella soli]
MATKSQKSNALVCENRTAWRQWLTDHHATESGVWLKLFRKNEPTSTLTHQEALDEALCFGWIDGAIRKGDGHHHLQYFAQRNPKSNWSRINKEKIAKLRASGLMTKAGLQMVELAQKTGTWTALDEVENGTLPPDLADALNANATAKAHFEHFPRSTRRGILEWLLNAKTEKTRSNRIHEIVAKAEKNERANFPAKKTEGSRSSL